MLGHRERAVDQAHLALGQAHRIIGLGELHQQHELIAADAGQGILAAQVLAQAQANFAQQLVAQVMTKGIVDRFETIQVDKHQGKATAPLVHRLDALLNAISQQRAVRQAGEHVMQGQVGEFLVGQGQGIGEYGGARFQARIQHRRQQRNDQYRQRSDQDQVIQALAAQARQCGTAEAVIGKARRSHPGVVHPNDGHAHHHGCAAPSQTHIRCVAPQVEGDPQRGAGSHHRDQQRSAEQGRGVVDARRHAHRGHAGVMHAGDTGPHHQCAKRQLPGRQAWLADQP